MRRIIHHCLFYFLLLSPLVSTSEKVDKIDSLQSIVNHDTTSIKTKIDLYTKLATLYRFQDSVKSISNAVLSHELAKEINYSKGIVNAKIATADILISYGHYDTSLTILLDAKKMAIEFELRKAVAQTQLLIGAILSAYGDLDKALENYEIATKEFTDLNDSSGLFAGFNSLSIVYDALGNAAKSLEYQLQAIAIAEARDDKDNLATSYLNIGVVYHNLEDYNKALDYYNLAIEKSGLDSLSDIVAYALNNIAEVYFAKKQFKESLPIYKKSSSINRKINDRAGEGVNLLNIGAVYYNMGTFDSSIYYFTKTKRLGDEINDAELISEADLGLGENYLKMGALDKGETYLLDAHKLMLGIGNPEAIMRASLALANLYENQSQFAKAIEFYKQYNSIRDSIYNENATKILTRLEAEYSYSKKVDSLQMVQALEKDAMMMNLNSKSRTQLATYIGLIITIILACIIYVYNQMHKNAKMQLQELNSKINNHNKSISKTNEELKKANEHLVKMNKTKTRFFSIISHDIRGPINTMLGFNELIKSHIREKYEAKQDSELIEITNYLQVASSQVLGLLDGLLKWSMKEEGVISYQPDSLNIQQRIDECVDLLEKQAKAKFINIDLSLEDGLVAWVDKNSFSSIIRNLLTNAIKFTKEGGELKINAKRCGNQVIIKISDNGIGMSKEKQKILFEINESKVSKGTNGEKGTGLGLNLVKDFVQMNQGTIDVKSIEEKGTTFTLRFPASKELKN